MTNIDWIIAIGCLAFILWYGYRKNAVNASADDYLRAGMSMPWHTVLLGVMATQASAITFLSAPGQAFSDGMRFVQYYFGLPLAMIVISAVFIPIFRRQNIFTAYEYLEQRFDRPTRILASILFLISRGLSTGVSIYAPSIILSTLLGLDIMVANVLVGGLLILYTWRGGAPAVARTQKLMFGIILGSMAVAGILIIPALPEGIGFTDTLLLAGKAGKLNIITTTFDINDRYNLLSGIVGGFFLALSYFGTDQSQVGRFLGGKDVDASRIGLLMNGLVKIPMQMGVLFVGALLAALYALTPAPVNFNPATISAAYEGNEQQHRELSAEWETIQHARQDAARTVIATGGEDQPAVERFQRVDSAAAAVRAHYASMAHKAGAAEKSDTNYVFLHFVRTSLPAGMVGLIFAIVVMASWGSISAALHSLATASVVDVHLLLAPQKRSKSVELARWHTLVWGVGGIGVAMLAARMGSLIEAVNILGSLFYGPILGLFLLAFFFPSVRGRAAMVATIAAEIVVLLCFQFNVVSFLWLNVIGAAVAVAVGNLMAHPSDASGGDETPQ
ncbi:MAG: sodium:solute symporter [Candidatus Kapabacteria bacterium]|nr:sodium:solute symporter [Candidatus Kapabacteria bacterium]